MHLNLLDDDLLYEADAAGGAGIPDFPSSVRNRIDEASSGLAQTRWPNSSVLQPTTRARNSVSGIRLLRSTSEALTKKGFVKKELSEGR